MSNRSDQKRLELERQVAAALDRALVDAERHARIRRFDTAGHRWIIFSDQHKGAGNGADDFRNSERAYNAALRYYLERGHTLVELGDVEDLWEEHPRRVFKRYSETMELTRAFARTERYVRIWGNHDDDWSFSRRVQEFMVPVLGVVPVLESLILQACDGEQLLGRILLIHGHQGTTMSDRYRALARIPVRWLWRPFQRVSGVSWHSIASENELPIRHNLAMHSWVSRQSSLLLVTGHTHRTAFGSPTVAEHLANEDRLCYFNAGCCCNRHGEITGIEIADGVISLVRWSSVAEQPAPRVIASIPLRDVFTPAGTLTHTRGE